MEQSSYAQARPWGKTQGERFLPKEQEKQTGGAHPFLDFGTKKVLAPAPAADP